MGGGLQPRRVLVPPRFRLPGGWKRRAGRCRAPSSFRPEQPTKCELKLGRRPPPGVVFFEVVADPVRDRAVGLEQFLELLEVTDLALSRPNQSSSSSRSSCPGLSSTYCSQTWA